MTTIIGLAILLAAVAIFPVSPGTSALLVLVLVGIDQLIGFSGDPEKNWTAAIVATVAVGYFLWSAVEGTMRLLGVL